MINIELAGIYSAMVFSSSNDWCSFWARGMELKETPTTMEDNPMKKNAIDFKMNMQFSISLPSLEAQNTKPIGKLIIGGLIGLAVALIPNMLP